MLSRRTFLASVGAGAAGAVLPARYAKARCSLPEYSDKVQVGRRRRLGYTEYGDGQIRILYFHGVPGSRIEARLMARAHGEDENDDKNINGLLTDECRIIAIDRPGIGRSDYLCGRTIRDWASDVKEFVKKKNIDEFSIIGVSGGTPFALACAADEDLKEHIRAIAIVSGHAPFGEIRAKGSLDRIIRRVSRHPRLARVVFERMRRNPGRVLSRFTAKSSKVDRDLANHPKFRTGFIETYCEATRCGAWGLVSEICLSARPWHLNWSDIDVDRVDFHVFHGRMDQVCPIEHAEFFVDSLGIPADKKHFYADCGHFTTVVRKRVKIVNTLMDAHKQMQATGNRRR